MQRWSAPLAIHRVPLYSNFPSDRRNARPVRAVTAMQVWLEREPCRSGRWQSEYKDGAQGRTRTTDTRIFSPLLYHLSYLGNPRGF